jgi:hypothetical protein
MFLQIAVVTALLGVNPPGPRIAPVAFSGRVSIVTDSQSVRDTVTRKRPRSIEYSDAYYLRLRIHQVASYTELPLFAAEWALGERLIKDRRNGAESDGVKTAHTTVALGLGALFTINTVTGVWNLWESRRDPNGRTRRLIHSVAMLGADAGFMWAGASAGSAGDDEAGANHHRSIALSSMALATAGTAMMWFFHD